MILLLALLLAGPAGRAMEAGQILAQAAAADRANRKQAAYFVFRELITTRERNPEGALTAGGTRTFEVTFVEGETYFRLTALNGMPLSERDEAEEERRLRAVETFRKQTPIDERRRKRVLAERQRLRLDLSLIAKTHQARLDGEVVEDGQRMWVLTVWPKRGAPKPKNANEWSLSLRGHLWLDQRTLHPRRAEMEQAYAWRELPEAARTRFRWRPVEDVWLIEEIQSLTPIRRNAGTWERETVQSYSNYRKFRAESVVVFAETP